MKSFFYKAGSDSLQSHEYKNLIEPMASTYSGNQADPSSAPWGRKLPTADSSDIGESLFNNALFKFTFNYYFSY